jgi:hypothetical protein
MKVFMTKNINDGHLTQNIGRIVEFEGFALKSDGPSTDHVTLCQKVAARYRLPKNEVISYGNRYYWRYANGGVEVCPVRVIDEDNFDSIKRVISKLF